MPAMLLSWGAGRWAARWRDGNRNVAAPERLMGSVDTVSGKRSLAPGPGRWNGHSAAAYLQRPLNTKERGYGPTFRRRLGSNRNHSIGTPPRQPCGDRATSCVFAAAAYTPAPARRAASRAVGMR